MIYLAPATVISKSEAAACSFWSANTLEEEKGRNDHV